MTQVNTQFGKVAVLLGGNSAEREVSLRSGQAVLNALQNSGIDAIAFDPQSRSLWELKELNVDRVFYCFAWPWWRRRHSAGCT